MTYCPKCSTKNDDDAVFCTNCGISLKSDMTLTIERHTKKFAKGMEQMGKRAGENMAQTAKHIHEDIQDMGKRMGHRVDRASRHSENWYDSRFGVIGPLISSFIFLIVLRLVIEILQIPSSATPESKAVASVFIFYILPLFAITLISNYIKYFAKKSYQFRIFSPLFHSIALVLFLWVVVKILNGIGSRLRITDIGTATTSLENSLPTIFIFVLLIGYVVLAVTMPRELQRKP
jgi:hypothetical protein